MRARPLGPLGGVAALAAALGVTALLPSSGRSAAVTVAPGAPAACSGIQVTDATGDGHHTNTDITAAWFARTPAGVRAVLVVDDGSWRPAHDDSPAAGWAVLWTTGGATRYARLQADQAGQLAYDLGTWTLGGGFASERPTTGTVSPTGQDGWVAIDIPAAAGGVDGARLGAPFALSYDGIEGAGPHWVDRAPGGVDPAGAETGADLVVAPCAGAPTPTPSLLPGSPTPPLPGASSTASGEQPAALTGVSIVAPTRLLGARARVAVTGAVLPARAGVEVTITATANGASRRWRATTDARGTYRQLVPIGERTQLRAAAGGLASQASTVDVQARVRISMRRTPSGGVVVRGTVSPALPGRVLWLRTDSVTPSARTRVRAGRFSFRLAHPGRGRYQALVLPTRDRVLRGLSNTGVIR